MGSPTLRRLGTSGRFASSYLSLLLCVSTLAASSLHHRSAWAVSDEERAGARAAAKSGLFAFEAGKWQEAIDYFQKAESIVHSQVHLLYLGRAQRELGHLVEAREAFLKVTREGAPSGASPAVVDAVKSSEKELGELEPRIPEVTVTVKGLAEGQTFRLYVDGREISAALVNVARPSNPGTHEFRVEAEGMQSVPVSLDLAEADRKTVELTLSQAASAAPKAPPQAGPAPESEAASQGGMSPLLLGGIVAAGLGAVGVGVGTVFLLDSQSKHDEVQRLCGNTESSSNCSLDAGSDEAEEVSSLNDQAGSAQVAGLIGIGVGGAALLTGAVLIALDLGSKESSAPTASAQKLTVRPYFGGTSWGLTGSF